MKGTFSKSLNFWLGVFVVSLTIVGFPLIGLGQLPYEDGILKSGTFFEKFLDLPPNEIGDTLGGIFGSLAFIAAFIALIMQSIELSEQRKELKRQADESKKMNDSLRRQSVENSIFEMLRTHIQVVNGLDLQSKDGEKTIATGRDCFVSFYRSMNKAYRKKLEKHDEPIARYYSYKDLWNKHGNDLGHYFRFLFNSFKFISETEEDMKYKYGRLFRAQLSDAELLLLFYNCLSDNGKPFLKYAIEYEIFDNLPTIKLLDHSHAALLPKSVYGNNMLWTAKKMKDRELEVLSNLKLQSP